MATRPQPTRYRLVDGRFRVVPREAPESTQQRGACPACGRTVSLLVPFGSRKLSYANHRRPVGKGHGGRCSLAMQPVQVQTPGSGSPS